MKSRPAALIGVLVCLGLTPTMSSALRPKPRSGLVDLKVPARKQEVGKIHQATGEVLAASADSLLLLHARGWKKQKMAFTLTAQTRETVSLGKGERIVVFYREIGGRRIVTRIRAASPSKRARGIARLHEATGEVLVTSPNTLVLLHARGRGKQRMAFTLTAQTRKTIRLHQGERIVVFYREIGGRRIAARIRAASPSRRTRRTHTAHPKS